MDAKKAVRIMSDYVNNMSMEPKEFVEEMSREHRTLQQIFTNLCFEWMKKCAENYGKGDFDGRNEYSCKTCSKIVEAVEEVGYRCPFI